MEQPQYGGWTVVKKLGKGSFGTVYKIKQSNAFGEEYAALKLIRLPQSEDEIEDFRQDGWSDEKIRTYFEDAAFLIADEIAIMRKVKHHTNIVGYEGNQIIYQENGIGFDVMIRMELLTPLREYLRKHAFSQRDVATLGIDLCRALERCQQHSIIHRDIKPGNILVSDTGDYKLGDFGIARKVEKTKSGMSMKGTELYMAPEVGKDPNYDFKVDIYSLGLVMYQLLNNDLLPFFPESYLQNPWFSDRENANGKRLSGEPIPLPSKCHSKLADIVLKACKFRSEDRYNSPEEMRRDLEAYLAAESDDIIVLDNTNTIDDSPSNDSVDSFAGKQIPSFDDSDDSIEGYADDGTLDIFHSKRKIQNLDSVDTGTERFSREYRPRDGNPPEPPEVEQSLTEKEEKKLTEQPSKPKWAVKIKKRIPVFCVIFLLIAVIGIAVAVIGLPEDTEQQIYQSIDAGDFKNAYLMIENLYDDEQNVDELVRAFVRACTNPTDYKRAVAAMKLLSDDFDANADFYRETIDSMYQRDKPERAAEILANMKLFGGDIAALAVQIEQERMAN